MLLGKENKSCNKHNTVVESLSNDSSVKTTFAVKGKKGFSILRALLTLYLLTQNKKEKGQREKEEGREKQSFTFPRKINRKHFGLHIEHFRRLC